MPAAEPVLGWAVLQPDTDHNGTACNAVPPHPLLASCRRLPIGPSG